MLWQDAIFTVGSVILLVNLMPTVKDKVNKPLLITSFPTAIVLAIFAGTYLSLDLKFAAVTTAINSQLWLILTVQRYRLDRDA